jgi:hypothetical protein
MEAILNSTSNRNDHHFDILNSKMVDCIINAYNLKGMACNSKMDSLLQKIDAAWTENTVLHKAYRASREGTALLKAAVDTLTKKLNKNIAISTSPLPETAITIGSYRY